jgi:integrase
MLRYLSSIAWSCLRIHQAIKTERTRFVVRHAQWHALGRESLVKRKLYPLLDSLGIERGGLHAFRHTNSTLMDRLGVPLKVRQQRLGHSDPSLTLGVYAHVESEDDVRFAEQLDGILRPNAPKMEKPESAAVANSGYLN